MYPAHQRQTVYLAGARGWFLEKDAAEQVADAEEDEDDRGHHDRHEADHRAETRSVALHEA